jgi:hypothetical protein
MRQRIKARKVLPKGSKLGTFYIQLRRASPLSPSSQDLSSGSCPDAFDEFLGKLEAGFGWVLCLAMLSLVALTFVYPQPRITIGAGALAISTCPPLQLRQRHFVIWLVGIAIGFVLL